MLSNNSLNIVNGLAQPKEQDFPAGRAVVTSHVWIFNYPERQGGFSSEPGNFSPRTDLIRAGHGEDAEASKVPFDIGKFERELFEKNRPLEPDIAEAINAHFWEIYGPIDCEYDETH